MTKKAYIFGNWKMNQTLEDINQFFSSLELSTNPNVVMGIAPQAFHLSLLLEKAKAHGVSIGAQNISQNDFGAFTGENAAASLKDLGASFTLVGHSERRSLYQEDDKLVNQKVHCALAHNLKVVLCVGETLEEREAGKTMAVIEKQIKEALVDFPMDKTSELLIAYEPVWAIGTGKTATPEMAEEVHLGMRTLLNELNFKASEIPFLYGGSVKPANIEELLKMENIDGALVGGASLKAQDYAKLCELAVKSIT